MHAVLCMCVCWRWSFGGRGMGGGVEGGGGGSCTLFVDCGVFKTSQSFTRVEYFFTIY